MRLVEERDEAVLFDRAAEVVRRAIEERCAERGACYLGVVGGKSLTALFARLARDTRPFGGRVEVFWLDERVAPGQKNADEILPMLGTMREAGIDLRWHPLDGGDRETILRQADDALALLSRRREPAFDVVVCSAGDDGHIASLFPNAPTLSMTEAGYVLVEDAPKPPPERVTVTPPLLTSATSALLFFTGGKKEAWSRFSSADVAVPDCPAKILLAVDDLTVFTSIV